MGSNPDGRSMDPTCLVSEIPGYTEVEPGEVTEISVQAGGGGVGNLFFARIGILNTNLALFNQTQCLVWVLLLITCISYGHFQHDDAPGHLKMAIQSLDLNLTQYLGL